MLTTATIGNPRVKFVVMGGCLLAGGGRTPADLMAIGRPPQGRIFSIYDEGDTEAGSRSSNFAAKPRILEAFSIGPMVRAVEEIYRKAIRP